jgi:hypothetical protein
VTEQFSADDRVPAPAAHDRRSGADGPPPVSTDAGNDLGQLRAPLGMTTIRWADRQIVTLTEERDKLLWLHAEAVFFGHGWCSQWLATRDTVHKRTAERDERQARIHKAVKVIDLSEGFGGEPTLAEVRAALTGGAGG